METVGLSGCCTEQALLQVGEAALGAGDDLGREDVVLPQRLLGVIPADGCRPVERLQVVGDPLVAAREVGEPQLPAAWKGGEADDRFQGLKLQRRLSRRHEVPLIPKRVMAGALTGADSTLDSIHLTTAGHARMAAAMKTYVDRVITSP